MSKTDVMKVLEKTKPRLVAEAKAMRETGSSFDDIAAFLTTSVGVTFSREVIRRWFIKQQ